MMNYFNYYQGIENKELNFTDRVIYSIICSFNEYKRDTQELTNIIGVNDKSIYQSISKLKKLKLIQGDDILTAVEKVEGNYFKVDLNNKLPIKENLVVSFIEQTPYKTFFGSIATLENILSMSKQTVISLLQTMTEKDILIKVKQGKTFSYTVKRTTTTNESKDEVKTTQKEEEITTDDNEEQIIEETPTIDVQPTTDVEVLNQRLTKASEVCKQLFSENKKLKTDIVLLNDMINTLNKKINSLYDRQVKYINLFQPVVERIDEIDSDINCIYDLTNNIRAKQETELDMNIIRGLQC